MPSLIHCVETFLKKHGLISQPLLLALSGGMDSLCLFYCLLACQKKHPFCFHVAHLDHGWRVESQWEAEQLKTLADQYQIPFHFKKLDLTQFKGNLEAISREARYQFFDDVCRRERLKGVLVGHHADDQAETVLKRLLEGAHWSRLAGLQEHIDFAALSIWRPLLKVSKNEIQQWILAHQYQPFEDKTNEDPRYLRARMRQRIIPWLSQEFGKEVVGPLQAMSQDLGELREYFDERLAPLFKQVKNGPFGAYLNLQTVRLSNVELKYLIRKVCEEEALTLSRSILNQSVNFLQQGVGNRSFKIKDRVLWIDRKRFFISKKMESIFPPPVPLKEGNHLYSNEWNVHVERVDQTVYIQSTSWEKGWEGTCQVLLPYGDYWLGPVIPSDPCFQRQTGSIGKWWTNHKVPAFFRGCFPVIWQSQVIYHEFLTGRSLTRNQIEESGLLITLIFKKFK
jgi:tRNA(Ile)-lysidine synthase